MKVTKLILGLLLVSPVYAVDIVYDDGSVYHVGEEEEVRVVPKGTPETLIAVEAIPLKDPKPTGSGCTEEGDLTWGGPQC